MKTRKIIGSLPNMEIPQLPVSLLSHMEAMGLLPGGGAARGAGGGAGTTASTNRTMSLRT